MSFTPFSFGPSRFPNRWGFGVDGEEVMQRGVDGDGEYVEKGRE